MAREIMDSKSMNSRGNSRVTHASPTAGSHREPAAGELSRSYGHFRSAHAFDVVCKGRELTESQDQRREGEQRALRARARMHFAAGEQDSWPRRCASGCTPLSRAMGINTCAVGALLGAASVRHAMESRLSSAACRLRALPGLARSSAADACSGGCSAPTGSASWRGGKAAAAPTHPPTTHHKKVRAPTFSCAPGGWVGGWWV